MTSDPWADAPQRITVPQIRRVIALIEDYTATDAEDLIHTLIVRNCTPGACSSCKQTGTHSRTCPTQGRD